MRVVTLNANGIRAAVRKGLPAWLAAQRADLVCLQEVRALPEQIRDLHYWPAGFDCYYRPSARPGYSGVAVYSRYRPDAVIEGIGLPEFDAEGRYLELRIGALSVVSFYLPSGSSGELRQSFKLRCMEQMLPRLADIAASGREYLLCGDWNIAHRRIDLANWRGNQNNSGFLPEERAWLDRVYDEVGLVDVFRRLDPRPDRYTWWSNRGQAWSKNVGWRLDLQVATRGLAATARRARIYTDARFSDHAPLILDYDFKAGRRRLPRRAA